MTLRELASLIDGLVFGNDLIHINMISPIESPKEDSILYVEKEKCIDIALNSPAAAILIPKNIILPNTNKPFIQVKDGKLAFIKVLSCFNKQQIFIEGIHNSVIIGNNVSIGNRLSIMAYTVIGDNVIIEDDTIIYPHCYIASNVHIGKGCIIHSNVTIERGSILGKNNIIYSGAVIGSDGFGYHDAEDIRYKIPQIGIVQTGDNVEIGANSTIDRATLGVTFIDSNTKIDNLVQIAHNCKIGKNCYIASQTGIAGSCILGDNVVLAGQVGIADHLTLGNNVTVLGQSGVTHSITAGEVVMGFPAKPVKEARKILASLSRLYNKKKI